MVLWRAKMELQKNKYVVNALWLAIEQAVNERNVDALVELTAELNRAQPVQPLQVEQSFLPLDLPQPCTNETSFSQEESKPIVADTPPKNPRYHTSYIAKIIHGVLVDFKKSSYVNDEGIFLARHCAQWLTKNNIDKFFVGIDQWEKRVNYAFADHLASKVNRYYSHVEHIGYGKYQFLNTSV